MSGRIEPGMMKYCVVGNIIKERVDEKGVLRNGTPAFSGGTRVYISRRFWESHVVVLGRTRKSHSYSLISVPMEWIENIRFSKTFKPHVLELMRNDSESYEMWWRHKKEDEAGARFFADMLNEYKAGNTEKSDWYLRNVMSYFGWRPRNESN